jgi:hypothetical protein
LKVAGDNEITDGIRARLDAGIADLGHMVLAIFPDGERGLPALNYTVGLAEKGLPELVLTGVRAEDARHILNKLVERLDQRGTPPAEGEVVDDLLGGGFKLRFRALSENEVDRNLFLATDRAARLGRAAPTAMQLVYQDESGRWPEDNGYSCTMALLLAQGDEETRQ